ncbi:MAG: trigger factor [Candidatus Limivivens sp.]|nr:trigger factor [Candidatus Limivivens sp.]
MKKKVIMALLLGLCVTATGYTGAYASETETETVAETETAAEEDTAEAASETSSEAATETAETEELGEEPEYKALDYVTLGQYKALEVTVCSLDVTEDEIQQQFYDDCSSHDKLLQVTEGEVAEGDVVNIDYVGSIDGVEFDGGTDKGVDLTIGSGTFIPGFEDGLIGAAIGKEINVNVTFPENYGKTDVAGKDAVFAVTVNFVKKAPEMTDDIVAEISDHKTVDEYRKGVEEQLKADKEAQQNSDKINGILNQIYSASTINGYPEEVVNYRTAQMKAYYTQIAEQSDMTLADFLSNQLQMTEEQFDQQCPAVIKQSMIQELLLKAVAESENMEISDEEYEAGIEKYIKSTGAESKETLLSQYTEAEIRRSLIMDKALDFLKENTTVKVEGEDESETSSETEAASEAESTSETEVASEAESTSETETVSEAETEVASETAAETETETAAE